jgi:hypothetical protein
MPRRQNNAGAASVVQRRMSMNEKSHCLWASIYNLGDLKLQRGATLRDCKLAMRS